MPWYIPIPGLIPISEYVKKKMCIYLLQRYLGKFFEEKLTLDQLSLDVYNGTGIVRNVSLDVQALNDLGEKQNWPMEFVDGYLEQLHVSVPWTSLLSDSTSLEVIGLKLTVQPKQRHESATSVFESMWSSMTSSMQLAKDYIQQEPNVNDSQPFEGIEKFAQTIDSVLTRVKIKFIDTTIEIEHVPKNCLTGVAIQIHIGTIDYLDEASSDPSVDDEPLPQDQGRAYVVSSFTTKRIHLDNVTLHTVEFPSTARTFSRSIIIDQQQSNELGGMLRKPEMDSIEKLINSDSSDNDHDSIQNSENNDHTDGRHEIIFGKLIGKQEIRVRLKHSEHVSGSKVSIEVNLGGCIMFLTPRQVHVLLELLDGISSPDIEDNSNVPPKQKCVEKLMTSLDYRRVEQDLQDQVNPNTEVTGLLGLCGWSKGMTDTDDVFHPMINNESCDRSSSSVLYDSAVSHASSSMESSLNSSMVSSISEVTSIRRRNNIENDPSAEITHFQIRIASLSVLLLHDDILSLIYDESSRSHNLIPSSIIQMKRIAENFFNVIGEYNITAYGDHQFDNTKAIFEQACHFNHLRLIAAAIQIEGRESTTLADFSISGKLTVAKLELLECLYNDTSSITPFMGHSGTSAVHEAVSYIRLIYFSENSAAPSTETANNFRIKPCLKVSFKHDEKFCNAGSKKGSYMPKTELVVTLDTCCIELDITIVNRISASINGVRVCVCRDTIINMPATRTTSKNEKNAETRLDFSVKSSEITINLRFPVPDLRPKHDMNRRPWWQREVRADYLTMCMYEASANTSYSTSLLSRKYTIRCKEAAISYHETESSIPVALGQIMSFTDSNLEQQYPWFEIELRPDEICLPETVLHDLDPMLQSAYPDLKQDNSGPFSSTRVMHESDTPHAKLHQDDSEQLIIPGDRAEMTAFIAETSMTSRMAITINLPTMYIDLVNKNIYEVLYNRINSDLLLWEPSAPEPHWPQTISLLGNVLGADANVRKGMTLDSDWFEKCKSGIQYESDSDTSSTDDLCPESENIFSSKYNSRSSSSRFRCNMETKSQLLNANDNKVGMKNGNSKLSEFALHIHVGNGKVHLSPPARDTSLSTSILPNHSGELLFLVENGASIFCVAGYAGDSSLTYVCVQVADVQLHHCDIVSLSNPTDSFDVFSGKCNFQLHPTIYKSDPGILPEFKEDSRQRDMFSVAVKIQANHETHYVKTVRVALGVNKATLRHRMCLEPNTWITQLIDFFNVLDYAIPGYTPKDVLTELHLHLWDCAIDYRPFHLQVRTVVTMESFSMSSHLSPKSNTSTLRFIAQECQIHLSDRILPKGIVGTAHKEETVHLIRDYIPAVEIRLFELSLRTNDKNSGINPHINLRASNNIVNIHTCSDSGKALIALMTYFAQDGDLSTNKDTEEPPSSSRITSEQTHQSAVETTSSNHIKNTMIPVEELIVDFQAQNISKLSSSQHQQVNEMLGDAMKDCIAPATEAIHNQLGEIGHGAQMFYFPDEGQRIPEIIKLPQHVTTDLGDITFRRKKSSDTDDEFCIIGEDDPLGLMGKTSTPEIRWLTKTTLIIIENHFTIPMGKTDVLKRPSSYPVPIMEYTLREMTIIWHMYGGYDFTSSAPSNEPTVVIPFVSFLRRGIKIILQIMESDNFDSIPKKGKARDMHFLIQKLALLFDSSMTEHDIKYHVILLDELLIATSFGFYACDLPFIIKILQNLSDNIAIAPIYYHKLESLLEKCLIPPILHKTSDLFEYRNHMQEFFSCLGYLLLSLYTHENFYNIIFDILYNLLIRTDVKFPPCCVSRPICINLLMKSDLPHVIGQLTSIAGNDCYLKLLEFADIILDKSIEICIPLMETGIVDYILLRLIPNVNNCNSLNIQDTFPYVVVDNVLFVSGLLVKLLMAIRALPREQIEHLKPPDVTAMWCLRYTLKYTVRYNLHILCRNNLMVIVLIWIELFDDFLFVHSGLADDLYLLCSSDLGVDEKNAWASGLRWSSAPLDYRFKQMLLFNIWLSIDDRTYAAVLQKYNIMPALLKFLTPDNEMVWLPEQYSKLVKITLSCLEKMFRLGIGIKDFIRCNGTPTLLRILAFHVNNPKVSSIIFGSCRVINAILEIDHKDILTSMIQYNILDILRSIAKGYLNIKLLSLLDKKALAIIFITMARFHIHYNKYSNDLNDMMLLFFNRIKKNEHGDFICDAKCSIAALKLLQNTIMIVPALLVSFVERGGVYLLLDILSTACYPLKLCILTVIVDMCEVECIIPYLLTWRSKGRTLMHIMVEIFKEDILSVGANVDHRCVIQDIELPLISKRQWEETTLKSKHANFSPVIIDMIGNCLPKVYAILHLLKFKNTEAINIINEEYKVFTEDLDPSYRIVLVLCENYMKIKMGETWIEVQKDIESSRFIPTAIDTHLLYLVKQHHLLWNQRLKQIQEKILLEVHNNEFKQEVDFYQNIKNTKLTLSLEALIELQYIAETSDSIFKQMRKLNVRHSLHDEAQKLHKTYMSYFNVNSVCNQKVTIETDKLVESKKDWETDFSDLKEISSNEHS